MSGCPVLQARAAHGETRDDNGPNEAPNPGAVAAGDGVARAEQAEKTHYSSYLSIEPLLSLQNGYAVGKPGGKGMMHPQELTFIIVHQVSELWFKVIIEDLRHCKDILNKIIIDNVNNVPALLKEATQLVCRAEVILKQCIAAFDVMDTIHPSDYLQFRDFLSPASGFQSLAFRVIETLAGLPDDVREKVHDRVVFSYLREDEQERCSAEARGPSINDLVLEVLSAVEVPAGFRDALLQTTRNILEEQHYVIGRAPRGNPETERKINSGVDDMASTIDDPLRWTPGLNLQTDGERDLYRQAFYGALFTMSYRKEREHEDLASLLDALLSLEGVILSWRARHINTAERMIGRRGGTGGTISGVAYLNITCQYRMFPSLWLVRKMLLRPSALPPLSSLSE